MDFCTRLKILRKEKYLSQSELAKMFNLTDRTIRNYESGERKPDSDTLIALADYFDCSIDYLVGNVDEPHHENVSIEVNFRETIQSRISALSAKSQEDLEEYLKLLEMRDHPDSHKS